MAELYDRLQIKCQCWLGLLCHVLGKDRSVNSESANHQQEEPFKTAECLIAAMKKHPVQGEGGVATGFQPGIQNGRAQINN